MIPSSPAMCVTLEEFPKVISLFKNYQLWVRSGFISSWRVNENTFFCANYFRASQRAAHLFKSSSQNILACEIMSKNILVQQEHTTGVHKDQQRQERKKKTKQFFDYYISLFSWVGRKFWYFSNDTSKCQGTATGGQKQASYWILENTEIKYKLLLVMVTYLGTSFPRDILGFPSQSLWIKAGCHTKL